MANDFLATDNLPKNIEAEENLLGIILSNSNVLDDVLEFVQPLDFYTRQNQIIFATMIDLNNRNEQISLVTLNDRLSLQKQLDDAGGIVYLSRLMTNAQPTARNAVSYAKLVQEKAVRRRLMSAAREIFAIAQNDDQDIAGLLGEAERNIAEIAEQKTDGSFKRIANVLDAVYDETTQRANQTEEIIGLSTGYGELDKVTAGLQADNLIILAARPAVGKTAFALNIAQNVAKENDVSVAIFSLEMGAESLVRRMLSAEGSINASNLQNGNLSSEEWASLSVSIESLKRTDIYIDDTPGIKMAAIRARCRGLAKKTGKLGLIVIDYLQLIEGSNKESRQQEVSEISRELKKLAKELAVPVIALSQLSRGVEQRQDKRPILSDIRESGAIEQDADIVAFLYRDDYYERAEGDDENEENSAPLGNPDAGVVELIIEKNRAGARGTIKLLFNKTCYKFANISYAPEPPGMG